MRSSRERLIALEDKVNSLSIQDPERDNLGAYFTLIRTCIHALEKDDFSSERFRALERNTLSALFGILEERIAAYEHIQEV